MLKWLKTLFAEETATEQTPTELADRGENLGARHLQNAGYKILLRNFECEAGEIDVIARLDKTLVFVEIKTRQNADPPPESAVDDAKRQQIIRTARVYLSRYGTPQPLSRFDVIGIVWPNGGDPEIRHHENAFVAAD